MREGVLIWRCIPGFPQPLHPSNTAFSKPPSSAGSLDDEIDSSSSHSLSLVRLRERERKRGPFASLSVDKRDGSLRDVPPLPTSEQLLKHPLALLALVPRDAALFAAGAIAGAASKTLTAPLDRVKLLMQEHPDHRMDAAEIIVEVSERRREDGGNCGNTHGLRAVEESAKKGIGFVEILSITVGIGLNISLYPGKMTLAASQAITMIGKEEGIKGYWKGNLPQVIRIIPYSAVQLFAYESYKVTYPLDVLRLRLAVETGSKTMSQVALGMLRDEGLGSFYSGLGPSLIGIAPYIAVNFCIFDLVKKSLPEKFQKRPETSLATGVLSATLATLMCYPLDTVRRQMQMRGSPYNTVLDAFPGIVARDGLIGLYRGFLPNALKSLPTSSIRLTTFDTVKGLIEASQKELQRIMEENRAKVV
ncbi:hypothetical protein ACLOJK_012366 [Asimina triloba]